MKDLRERKTAIVSLLLLILVVSTISNLFGILYLNALGGPCGAGILLLLLGPLYLVYTILSFIIWGMTTIDFNPNKRTNTILILSIIGITVLLPILLFTAIENPIHLLFFLPSICF